MMSEQLPKARAMTRYEVKTLRGAGLDPAFWDEELTMKLNAEMVDWILDHVYQGHDFTNTPYSNCLELATMTYQLTYRMSEDEAKNS
jgi:hypothetical protein